MRSDEYWSEVDGWPETVSTNPALELDIIEDIYPVDDYPKYEGPGRILFEVIPADENYDMEIEVLDFDGETSIYWLHEGFGIEYWLEHESGIDLKNMSGKYIVMVNGEYIRGDSMWDSPIPTDDEEEWWIEEAPVKTDLESLL